ncbi:MAG: hypothetical protein M1817_003565 [Caeruleum heppii]|nr:MAG: hypothetical protein M1817_003565 [Caeruleum heppii]
MACTQSTLTIESFEDSPKERPAPLNRRSLSEPAYKRPRRPSAILRKKRSSDIVEDDSTILKVDIFLSELERRLGFLEAYGNLKLDTGISRAYATLHAVREACSHASEEVMGAGRRRAKILVETVESRYQGILATRETLEQKIHAGIKILEDSLADFEARAYAMREVGLSNMAGELMDEGLRRMDEGIERAKGVVDEGMDRARRVKESMKESIEHAITIARERGLIRYEDLPEPWKVNPHILRGYRFNDTKTECIRSVIRVSNELFNIWSHAVGLVIVLAIAFYFYPTSANFGLSSKADIAIAAVFFFAACKCLVCSTVWHTMNSIAEQTLMERFACVDYTGISLLIAASIMTTEYTAFYCEPVSRSIYISATALLGIGGVVVAWHPTFNRADMRWARVAFYICLGITGLIPVIQLNLSRGPAWTWYFYAPVMKSAFVYILGAVIYASQIPERWWPGGFDYFGGSHNLWHVAVLGGILFHYLAMQDFFAGAFHRARVECAVS